MDTVNVLITSCGRRVELVKEFIRARNALGIRGVVVGADASASAPAMYFADVKVVVPRLSDPTYILKLIDIINQHNIDLVVPTIDTELQLLAEHKAYIECVTKARILVSEPKIIEICNNKMLSTKFFADHGFAVPRTLTEGDVLRSDYNFPLFIKPLDGSSSINAFKVNNQKELDFFRGYISNPILQEFVQGVEYTVDAFMDFDGNIVSVVPRKRLATRGGEILKGEIDMNKHIINDIERLINVLNPIGHITVQGIVGEDKVFKYIEINPRYGGGAPMSIKAGANSPKFLYNLLRGVPVGDFSVMDRVVFSRFDDSIMIEV